MSVLKDTIERRLAEIGERLESIPATAETEARSLSTEETTEVTSLLDERDTLYTQREQLNAQEVRAAEAAKHVETVQVIAEPNPVYRKGSTDSFFRDLAVAQKPNMFGHEAEEARTRLVKSQETRAGDMTTVAGAGGEFAPPLWLINDFVALARPGRVTADLLNHDVLPSGVSSINLPKVATGVTVAVQATQNSAVSDTAMTTTSVSSGITTLAGKQIISLQLIQQSGIPFDQVILQDLAKAYAVQLDTQVLYGTNANNQLRGLVGVAVNNAFTTASPAPASVTAANSLYYVVSKAAAAIQAAIYQPADAIVMHPNRWAWILGSVDANSRPLVIPNGAAFNPVGTTDAPAAQGPVGSFGGYAVYTDPNISLTANSATNQDEIYVLRRDALWLYESALQAASFDATYADNLSLLFRVHGYAAFIPNRYTGAVQSIRGTGLVAP